MHIFHISRKNRESVSTHISHFDEKYFAGTDGTAENVGNLGENKKSIRGFTSPSQLVLQKLDSVPPPFTKIFVNVRLFTTVIVYSGLNLHTENQYRQ